MNTRIGSPDDRTIGDPGGSTRRRRIGSARRIARLAGASPGSVDYLVLSLGLRAASRSGSASSTRRPTTTCSSTRSSRASTAAACGPTGRRRADEVLAARSRRDPRAGRRRWRPLPPASTGCAHRLVRVGRSVRERAAVPGRDRPPDRDARRRDLHGARRDGDVRRARRRRGVAGMPPRRDRFGRELVSRLRRARGRLPVRRLRAGGDGPQPGQRVFSALMGGVFLLVASPSILPVRRRGRSG